MNISFYLDDTLYTGIATPIEQQLETDFRIELEGIDAFTICPCADYGWKTKDQISRDMVRAAGNEVEKRDDASSEMIQPGRYYSGGLTGGDAPIIVDGEIINEPDDVDESSL